MHNLLCVAIQLNWSIFSIFASFFLLPFLFPFNHNSLFPIHYSQSRGPVLPRAFVIRLSAANTWFMNNSHRLIYDGRWLFLLPPARWANAREFLHSLCALFFSFISFSMHSLCGGDTRYGKQFNANNVVECGNKSNWIVEFLRITRWFQRVCVFVKVSEWEAKKPNGQVFN